GDASMASPFTYRGQNIKCTKILARSGKATLATVIMMYKLMALNSLTTAFALSVLTINGVKYSDFQATAESIFVSVLFLSTSHAKGAKKLTSDRVIFSLFDHCFYLSVIVQAGIHILSCSLAWWLAATYGEDTTQMDGPFKPSLVNTV